MSNGAKKLLGSHLKRYWESLGEPLPKLASISSGRIGRIALFRCVLGNMVGCMQRLLITFSHDDFAPPGLDACNGCSLLLES